jgi:hypothetical protein
MAYDCCIGDAAQISTAGALDDNRTPAQKNYLTTVCKLTRATIDGKCQPEVGERVTPPAPVAAPVGGGGEPIVPAEFIIDGKCQPEVGERVTPPAPVAAPVGGGGEPVVPAELIVNSAPSSSSARCYYYPTLLFLAGILGFVR